jgi:hypothetical protein
LLQIQLLGRHLFSSQNAVTANIYFFAAYLHRVAALRSYSQQISLLA